MIAPVQEVPEVHNEAPVPAELPVLVAVAGRVRSAVHDDQFGEGATQNQACCCLLVVVANLGAGLGVGLGAGLGAGLGVIDANPETVSEPDE